MEYVYAVMKHEIWDGENWNENYGSFRSPEDAKAELKRVRDCVYPSWENETIDQDNENGFYAFRDGWYDEYHINLYILKMILWEPKELKV